MNKNLVKMGKVYRYNFSDNDIVTGKLRVKLSDNTEFLADYITFVVEKGMVKEIEVRGCVISQESRKKEKAKLQVRFFEAVPFDEIKKCKITAGELLHRDGERVVV
jgi:hypothetical protein